MPFLPTTPDRPRTGTPVSRRTVLLGGASLLVLAACGGGGDDDSASSDGGGGTEAADTGSGKGSLALVSFIDTANALEPGSPQRLAVGIGDDRGALISDGPASLEATFLAPDGTPLGAPLRAARHDDGLPRAYYPFLFTPPVPGSYVIRTTVRGQPLEAAFQIPKAGVVGLPQPGEAMPVADTPTVTDHRGVEPICTEDPTCALHRVNLRDALSSGRPTALLVSTPAYCQTAICGPVLDVVLDQAKAFPQVQFIHAEVYKSAKDVEANGATAQLAPLMSTLELAFEPCLFLVAADGSVADRLDVIFDAVELREQLTKLTS